MRTGLQCSFSMCRVSDHPNGRMGSQIAPLHPEDPATYPAMAETVREIRVGPVRGFAQALVVHPMACGVGACQGCAVPVARGTKLACTDGPVFDLLELQ